MKEASLQDYQNSVDRLAELAPYVDKLLTAHNAPIADGDYLLKLKLAFDAIQTGSLPFEHTEGANEYQFGDFSAIVPGE